MFIEWLAIGHRVRKCGSLDHFNHGQSHVDAVGGVLGAADGQPRDAVVAVAQDLDPHALVLLKTVPYMFIKMICIFSQF